MTIDAYPLQWPVGFPRTKIPQISRFKEKANYYSTSRRTEAVCRDELFDELRRLGASRYIVSTDVPLKMDGRPYANRRAPDDTGVAVYFVLKGEQHVIACDMWRTIRENYRALTKTIEAMRGLDRWGASDILARAFTGFKALPEKGSGTPWWSVLGLPSSAASESEIKRRFRQLSTAAHPDRGGKPEDFRALVVARDQGLASAGAEG